MLAGSRGAALCLACVGFAAHVDAADAPGIRGVVIDAKGAPVAGAVVRAWDASSAGADPSPLGEVTSTATGSFALPALGPNELRLEARHPAFLPSTLTLDARADRPGGLRLVLNRGGRIEGRATLLHGTPVAGLVVDVQGAERWRGVTGEDGSFSVDRVPPGHVDAVFLADAKGAVEFARGEFPQRRWPLVLGDGETTVVTFRSDAVRVRGRLTRVGLPLAGVLLRPDEGEQRRIVEGAMSNPGGVFPGATPRPYRPAGQAVTTADGSFELFYRPGSWGYVIESLDGTRFHGRHRIDIPDLDDSIVDVDLPKGSTVSGVVVDRNTGKGLAAALQIRAQAGRLPDGEVRWWRAADGDGRFRFDLEPGDYVVGASFAAYLPAEVNLSSPGGARGDLRLEMEQAPSIGGRVVVPEDLQDLGVPITARAEDGADQGAADVGRDGTFRIPGLQQKRYNVLAGWFAVGWDMQAGVEAGATDLRLVLRPPGQLHLLVLSPDGKPIPSAWVILRSVSGALVAIPNGIGNPASDDAGRLELTVPAGVIELEIVTQLYRATVKLDVAPGASVTSSVKLAKTGKPPL